MPRTPLFRIAVEPLASWESVTLTVENEIGGRVLALIRADTYRIKASVGPRGPTMELPPAGCGDSRLVNLTLTGDRLSAVVRTGKPRPSLEASRPARLSLHQTGGSPAPLAIDHQAGAEAWRKRCGDGMQMAATTGFRCACRRSSRLGEPPRAESSEGWHGRDPHSARRRNGGGLRVRRRLPDTGDGAPGPSRPPSTEPGARATSSAADQARTGRPMRRSSATR